MKYEVRNRWSSEVQFAAEIACKKDDSESIKLGLAVKWAIKTGAYLADANLADANLAGANLVGANLTRANLAGANLVGANLTRANLVGAYLAGAYLAGADLEGANLADAYLADANLADANLAGANLAGANLADANLTRAKNIPEIAQARTNILPDGELIGWKKCGGGEIAKLRIPADAKRSNAAGRKCRAEYVEVLEMFGGDKGKSTSRAPEDEILTYRKGAIVRCVKPFDENRWNECASGIHFYITRLEAENN